MWGFDVRATGIGAEAIDVAAAFRPDVAIIEPWLHEDVDGFAVARALSAPSPHPFLIALTGHGEAGEREAAVDAGFDHYALKPWDVREMHAVLTGPISTRTSRASN